MEGRKLVEEESSDRMKTKEVKRIKSREGMEEGK